MILETPKPNISQPSRNTQYNIPETAAWIAPVRANHPPTVSHTIEFRRFISPKLLDQAIISLLLPSVPSSDLQRKDSFCALFSLYFHCSFKHLLYSIFPSISWPWSLSRYFLVGIGADKNDDDNINENNNEKHICLLHTFYVSGITKKHEHLLSLFCSVLISTAPRRVPRIYQAFNKYQWTEGILTKTLLSRQ